MRLLILASILLANLLVPQRNSPVTRYARTQAVNNAVAWLHSVQRDNGGFGDCSVTADAILVIAEAGQNPSRTLWAKNGSTPLQALIAQNCPLPNDSGVIAKMVLALTKAQLDPHNFNGIDLIARLQAAYDPSQHTYHPYSNFRLALVIRALAVAHAPIEPAAVQFLRDQQRTNVTNTQSNGGWSWPYDTSADADSDVDTTGEVMQALAAAGVPNTDAAFARAEAYLRNAQNADAAWPGCANSGAGSSCDNPPSNSNSTSLAVAGLLASGRNPFTAAYVKSDKNPVMALLAYQETSGAFAYQLSAPESRLLATLDALNVLTPVYPGDRFLPGIMRNS